MFRKNYFIFLLMTSLLLVGSLTAFAQTAPIRGKVTMIGADGKDVPVADALIETFRTDINQKGPSAKTDKKGVFNFVGLQIVGTYFISVSGPNISPNVFPNIKAGNEAITITVVAGDGKKLTEAEARESIKKGFANGAAAAGSTATTAEQTADQKKQQAEYAKKVAEVTDKNAKIKNADSILTQSFKDGNEALKAKNYETAIAKYNEAIAAVPDFVGSTPAVLNNKGIALRERAVLNYNTAVKQTDTTAKLQGLMTVKKDLTDAADTYNQSWTILKSAPSADISATSNYATYKADTLRGIKDTFRLMAATEQVEPTKLDIGKTLMPEYLTIETDPVEKAKSQLIMGDVYRVSGDSDNAILEYKKVLEGSPDNLDALAGVGFSLVNLGYINNDKTKMQEGANFLQKFYTAAPDTNKYKADAKGLLDTLKTEQKVAPQKITTPAKKRG